MTIVCETLVCENERMKIPKGENLHRYIKVCAIYTRSFLADFP